jgi:hypothetical protein
MKEANPYKVAYTISQHGHVSCPHKVTSQRKKKQPYLQQASLKGGSIEDISNKAGVETMGKDDKLTNFIVNWS